MHLNNRTALYIIISLSALSFGLITESSEHTGRVLLVFLALAIISIFNIMLRPNVRQTVRVAINPPSRKIEL